MRTRELFPPCLKNVCFFVYTNEHSIPRVPTGRLRNIDN
jgi:hypothetical protein